MSAPDTIIEDLTGVEVLEHIVGNGTAASSVTFTATADFTTAPTTVQAALAELASRIAALQP